MQYYRCKCGKTTGWGSMSFNDCEGCSDCNTTLETHPSLHKEIQPHEFREKQVQTDEGKKPLSVCCKCGKSKIDIERGV